MKTALHQQLDTILEDVGGIHAELALAGGLLIFIVLGLFLDKNYRKSLPIMALITLMVTGGFVINELGMETSKPLYGGMITQTNISSVFKLFFILSGILTIAFTEFKNRVTSDIEGNLEYYTLLLSGILGLNLMAISSNLVMLFLAIEMVSLSSYALVLFKNDARSKESGTKYLLYGMFVAGIMIYGMSLVYIFTGSLNYTNIAEIISTGDTSLLFVIGMFFLLTGAFFKLSLAPFHIWAPDVYEGSPMPIVAYLSVAPKLGGLIAVAVFLSHHMQLELIYGWTWREVLAVLSIVTMIIGNFSALLQKNVKRMLAYSSIAHAGFLLVGIVAFNSFGVESLLFYAIIYLFMNFSIFMLVDIIVKQVDSEKMKDFAGLGLKNPLIGVLIIIVILSLIGLPPTAGFSAKLLVFTSLWETAQQKDVSEIFYYLFIIGLFNTVIALFYYIKIPFYMFFRKAETEQNIIELSIYHKVVLILVAAPILVLFFAPNALLELFHQFNNLAKYFL